MSMHHQTTASWFNSILLTAFVAWVGAASRTTADEPRRADTLETGIVPLCPRAHAHNDYLHKRPLLDALDHGFGSVEVDVHLKNGQLLVGHDAWVLQQGRTLQSLYLNPLRERVRANRGYVYRNSKHSLTLLIDFKSDGKATYQALRTVLTEYNDLFAEMVRTQEGSSKPAVVAIISGNRPYTVIEQDVMRRVGIDGRLSDLDSDAPKHLIPLISDTWRQHFTWRGEGPMPKKERIQLRTMVNKAHAHGRRLRFWATPENEVLWQELLDAGVDLIGTDDLDRLQRFLLKSSE